jgi:hypothetical protein
MAAGWLKGSDVQGVSSVQEGVDAAASGRRGRARSTAMIGVEGQNKLGDSAHQFYKPDRRQPDRRSHARGERPGLLDRPADRRRRTESGRQGRLRAGLPRRCSGHQPSHGVSRGVSRNPAFGADHCGRPDVPDPVHFAVLPDDGSWPRRSPRFLPSINTGPHTGFGCQMSLQPAAVCGRLCHAGQIRSMRSVHPVSSRLRLRSIAGLESSAAVSCSSSGPSKAAVS